MATQIFVNLPVKNLDKSMAFFKGLGFKFNKKFTDKTAACMIIGENIHSMLLTRAKFEGFAKKKIADTSKTKEVLTAISVESRAKVDILVGKAVKLGGTEPGGPMDHGFMYYRSFDDLDGHTWEIFWMDPKAVK